MSTPRHAPSPAPPATSAVPPLVVETGKNRVSIAGDRVHKTFKDRPRAARRARREVASLRRLAGLAGVPALLELSTDGRSLVMSRLPGKPLAECARVSEATVLGLRELVERMLGLGVARHSLPTRDILVAADGTVGLVDFERSTLRLFRLEPSWLVACAITRFHMRRLVRQYAPELLSERERRRLRVDEAVRAAMQRPLKWKRRLFRR